MAASRTTATSSRPSRGAPATPAELLDSEVARSGLPAAPTVGRAGRRIGSVLSAVEVEVRHGGQPYYRYLISAE